MKRAFTLAVLAGALLLPAQARAAETASGVQVKVTGDAAYSASGCRTVDIAKTGWDLFRLDVVYRFHQRKSWCWRYPRITWKAVSTYVSDVDPNMEYRGVINSSNSWYYWCCGTVYSGHYSLRQGKFENCILWFPCTRTEYPWVKIWARGDGSYRYATGL